MIPWWKLLEGSPTQPTDVVNRGTLAPVVEYGDGSHALGLPGLITEPVEAWQRLMNGGASENIERMQRGLPYDPQAMGDALAVTGAAAMGSVAAPKPSGAFVASGSPNVRFEIPEFSKTTGHARASIMSGPDEIGHGLFYDLPTARGSGAPDALMLRNIAINKDYQRQGIATALQKEMERRTGKKVLPDDSQLSAAEYARWMKNDPEAVRRYVDVGNGQFRPSLAANPKEAAALGAALQGEKKGIRAYHGTATEQPIDTFSIDRAGSMAGTPNEKAVWFTPSPDDASNWARIAGSKYEGDLSAVYPVDVGGNLKRIAPEGSGYNSRAFADAIERAKGEGYDGAVFEGVREFGSPVDQIAMWAPGHVRSATTGELLYANPKEAAALGAAVQGERDDSLVSIVRKYGIAGAASLYGVSEADINGALMGGELMRDR